MLFLLPLAAMATTHQVVLDMRPDALDESTLDAALDAAVATAPAGTTGVEVWVRTPDGALVPAESLLPPIPSVPVKEPGAPVDHPGASAGALSGKAVYLSQCHGWKWYDSLDAFSLQRPLLFDTVEDYHNPEGMNQYLARYLENAGASVFTAKERDMQTRSAIADDDGAGYAESGDGFEDGPAGFAETGPWGYGEDPFGSGGTRRFPAAGGAVATWIPEVPADGYYAVYLSWDSDADNAPDAHYRITHPGGVIDRTYDQTVHGSTWQYAETLWLPAGVGGLTVELIGDSACGDCRLSADAVRVGGGQGEVSRHGELPGRPRWEDAAVLYTQYNGAPTSVYDPYGDGDGSDPSSRSRWAAWEHPAGEDAVYLSWHSNAATGDARGTTTLLYDGSSGEPVEGSYELSELVQEEVVDAIRVLWDSGWSDRGLYGGAYSELNPSHNGEMPSTLIELAFHDNETDAAYLKDPRFRRDAARAMMHAIIRYFAERDGTEAIYLPEPPTGLSVRHGDDGRLVATWSPGPVGDPYGDAAEGYVVYTSSDGHCFDGGTAVDGTSLILEVAPGRTVFVRVAAQNAGGISFPTEVIGARRSPDGWAPVLVVGAFDRLEESLLPWESVPSFGDVRRMDLPRVNPRDTTVATGLAVAHAGWFFDSVSDEALPALDGYDLVVWAAGQDSTHDESFSADQQSVLRAFVDGGGALWASGSEILWDLDEKGDVDDQAFAAEVLGATMQADDAGTTSVDGVGLLDGLVLDFGEVDGAPYPVDYPDALESDREVLATYAGGATAGVMGDGVVLFGFPFECVGDPDQRDGVAAALLPALVPDYIPPEVDTGDTGDTGDAGDTGAPDGHAPGELAPPPGGCGCSGVGVGGGLGWLVGLLLLVRRRRDSFPTR